MIRPNKLYHLDDVVILPEGHSEVRHLTDPIIYENNLLPVFAAPSNGIVNEDNNTDFKMHSIRTFLQYSDSINPNQWYWLTVPDFEHIFIKSAANHPKINVLIDTKDGNQMDLFGMMQVAKIRNPQLSIMLGGVSSPENYRMACIHGADAVVLFSSHSSGVHYPMASLIDECRNMKVNNGYTAKIVAACNYSKNIQLVKALALGADYVMVHEMFVGLLEAAASNWVGRYGSYELYQDYVNRNYAVDNIPSTTQMLLAERCLYKRDDDGGYIAVKSTLDSWIEEFLSVLRSTMRATNSDTLKEFTQYTQLGVIK